MTVDELKNYPNGVCLGYSSIEYLYNNKQELLDSYTVKFMADCNLIKVLQPKLVFPFVYGCKDKIYCRIKIKTNKGFENVGIL